MNQDYTAPHSLDSERVILNALHFNPDWLEDIRSLIPDPDMFHLSMHEHLYKGILELSAESKPFDLLLAAEASGVSTSDALDVIDKLHPDLWLIARVQRSLIAAHALQVQDAWIKREAFNAAHRRDGAIELTQKLQRLTAQGSSRAFEPEDLAMLLISEAGAQTSRLDYPFSMWQHASGGGVRPDELIVIAARPGTGKSVMLAQWAWKLASSGKRVLFMSAEMSAKSLTTRIASHITGINLDHPVTSEELEANDTAADIISRSGLRIDEVTGVGQIEAALKKRPGETDVVFVDYLQQLTPMARTNGEFEQVTAVTRELDSMSMKYGLPFVVASQYSRNAEGQQPSMADLRSSGQIEQAADVIISLWSKPEETKVATRAKVYVDVLKNRNGYTLHNTQHREYALWLNKPVFTFSEMETYRK